MARKGALESGHRIVLQKGAPQVVDSQPVDDMTEAYRLPAANGGGFLFLGMHTVRYATTFDGPLTIIGSVSSKSRMLNVGVGWSWILISSEKDLATLHELPSGRLVQSPIPGLAEILAVPGYLVARTNAGVLFVSKEDDRRYKRVDMPKSTRLYFDGQNVVAETDTGLTAVGSDGQTAEPSQCSGCTITTGPAALKVPYYRHSDPRPIEDTMAFSRRMSDSIALGVDGGTLTAFDIATGKKTVLPKAFGGLGLCHLIRGGTPSFVACDAQAATLRDPATKLTLFRVGTDLTPVLEIEVPTLLSQEALGHPNDDAPLVFADRCQATSKTRGFCVRQDNGAWADVLMPPDAEPHYQHLTYVADVAVSRQGEPYLFGWSHPPSELLVVDGHAGKSRLITMPNNVDLDWSTLQIDQGDLRFVLKDGDLFTITSDDKTHIDKLDGLSSFSGARGLNATPGGKLHETIDGRKTWHEVDLPPDGLPVGLLRCGPVGCDVGPWIRVGWALSPAP